VEDVLRYFGQEVVHGFNPHHHGVIHIADFIAPGTESGLASKFLFDVFISRTMSGARPGKDSVSSGMVVGLKFVAKIGSDLFGYL
jgi:hypothetical protein